MDLEKCLHEILSNEEEVIPLAGYIKKKKGYLHIYPKLEDKSVEFIVPVEFIVDEPILVEPPEFVSTDLPVNVVKVIVGALITVDDQGCIREVYLTRDPSKDPEEITKNPSHMDQFFQTIKYLEEIVRNEPHIVPLAGKISHKGDSLYVYPMMEDESLVFMVPNDAIVDEPVRIEPPDFLSTELPLHFVKVKLGTVISVLEKGSHRPVELTWSHGRNSAQISHSSNKNTQCFLITEFDCYSGKYIGPCIGLWECRQALSSN